MVLSLHLLLALSELAFTGVTSALASQTGSSTVPVTAHCLLGVYHTLTCLSFFSCRLLCLKVGIVARIWPERAAQGEAGGHDGRELLWFRVMLDAKFYSLIMINEHNFLEQNAT